MSVSLESPRESWRLVFWRLLSWGILCCGALAVLMIAAVHVPPRVKLFGLFSLGLGLIAGWVAGRIALLRCVHNRLAVFPAATLIIAAALLGMSAESHRLWRQTRQAQFDAEIRRSPAGRLFGSETFANLSADVGRFNDYLAHRYSPLANSAWGVLQTSARWPEFLLGMEVLIGSLAGGLVATRLIGKPFCVSCGSWHEPQRSQLLDLVTGNRCLKILAVDQTVSLPNDARLLVQCSVCRCSGVIPTIRCSLERPGQAAQILVTVQPDREIYLQLSAILDGGGTTD